mmetsp:Transcript_21375/g.34219  ORF Transcript_21375/g.34219 Transcript_21375/m.34219 type:complete len:402 (-) Transcript_21375:775-1980(-)|eukprot:CAMPEP_0197037798 /NCGR_PEP_ID=MMETSP1384-20130603/14918_1 /TAXON_ID=29189 /ORGANISM="Ammonia sp." /LENGTH=401 /DNA_ID=CAMNT_0042468161 /DNA_START=166 /DNA_END=1371 /DNA_ORIENTATION=-
MEQHQTAICDDECKTSNEWTFGQDGSKQYETIKPKFNNLKEEVLGNSFACISKEKWNDILKKVQSIINFQFGCKQRIQFGRLLKANKIKKRHILALKCYTDSDELQCAFRKCFLPHIQTAGQYKQRLSEFYHWRRELKEAFTALSKCNIKWNQPRDNMLYHGVKCKSVVTRRSAVFDGPLSCTTDINIARDFAGKYGMILAIKPMDSVHQMLDLSLISDFPQEKEVLLFNHHIAIQDIIVAEDYDNNYSWFKQQFVSARSHKRSNSLSEQVVVENLKHLHSKQDDLAMKQEPDEELELIAIGAVEQETKELNDATLFITQSCQMYLLCSIYEYCQRFISNLSKYTEKRIYDSEHQQEMYDRLKRFRAFVIQKEIYRQFLEDQQIDHAQCKQVFSEYIRISA